MRKTITILLTLLIFSHLQGCESAPKAQMNRVTVELHADGTTLLDGKKTPPEDIKGALAAKTQGVPKEKIEATALYPSLLEVLIKTEADVRYEAVADVLVTCCGLNIRRTYFSHPDVDNGREIELWLPVDGHASIVSEPLIEKSIIILEEEQEGKPEKEEPREEKTERERQGSVPGKETKNPFTEKQKVPFELRVKLLWVDRNNPGKRLSAQEDPEGNAGMVSLKLQDTPYVEGNQPDWNRLEEKLRSIAVAWIPTKHFQKCPVTVDPMKKVHFADVLGCAVICRQAGMGEITLAVPVQ